MNLLDARTETMAHFAAGNAVLWESGSGLGKSQTAFSMFEEIRDRDAPNGIRWGFGVIFAATQTPPDWIGYQFKGEKAYNVVAEDGITTTPKIITVTDPSIPLWMMMTDGKGGPSMPAFMFDRCFLVIDEYGQGDGDNKRCAAEVLLNGGTAPWYLPPGSIRLACTNVGARYGVSKDFDFCIARRCLIQIEGNIDITLRYLNKPYYHQGAMWQTLPVTKAWAQVNPAIVFEKEPPQQGPWCNPRQLCAADRYIQSKWKTTGKQEIDPLMQTSVAGYIGMGAAASLCSHLEFLTQLPTYAAVVADPAGTEVPQRADLQMLMAYQMAGFTKPEDLGPCIQYIQRLPGKDMQVSYITSLLSRDYKGIITQPAMQGWIAKNATLVSIVASLSQS